MINKEFQRMQQLAGINEIEVNKPDPFDTFIKSYSNYLESISRAEMFDKHGNYNNTLKKYHEVLKKYAKEGTKKQKTQAKFILSWI